MAEKRINGRIILKHDTEAHWNLADNFYPEKGEFIIYDIDDTHNYERLKVGDGVHLPKDLPFYAGSWNDLKDKPSTMAPSGHRHDVSGVNGLQSILDEIYEWLGDAPVSEQISTAIENKAEIDHTHDTLYVNLVDKLPSAESWIDVAYGNGTFVTVAPYTDVAAYSTDGISWNESKLPFTSNWTCVTYGNNRFVALSSNSMEGAYSLDGITWQSMTLSVYDSWTSVVYGDGCFIAVASGSSSYIYSYGGTNWYSGTLPTSEFWSDICYDGSRFIITGEYSPVIITGSHNNWTQIDSTTGMTMTKSASNGNQLTVVIGGLYSSGICWTDDGSTWTKASADLDAKSDVAYGNGKFVIISSGNKALYSSDGKNWTQTTMPDSLSWKTVTYGGDKFIALASSSIETAISYDGINWAMNNSTMQDKDGNDAIPMVGSMLSNWSRIYDSGEITSDVNVFSNIDISGYKHIMVAIKCVNTTKSSGGISGAFVFKGSGSTTYAFKNILPNLIKNTTGTSGGMAIFKIVNGFIICENAMRAQSAENILSSTEAYGADNLTPVGGGIITCAAPVTTLMVSNGNMSSSYYYGAGSRVIVWGCTV
jgi:hypothetical protein